MQFDRTRGFPGEGPRAGRPQRLPLQQRPNIRLDQGRLVSSKTRARRDLLLQSFSFYLAEIYETTLDIAVALPLPNFVKILVCFGQHLYHSEDPPGAYIDTLLAVCDMAPHLRGHLQAAWDLVDTWKAVMPFASHVPCPSVVAKAMFCVAMLWGWVDLAIYIQMSWCGLLRATEALKLVRADVLLPRDLLQEARVAILRIRSPKMRRIRARRECAKLECPILVRMLEVMLAGVAADTPLFTWTPNQMRKLHDQVVRFLGIPTVDGIGITPGSHRGGGATALFESTGSLDFVRWRGRSSSQSRTYEIYIQEISALSVLPALSESARDKVCLYAQGARAVALAFIAENSARANSGCIGAQAAG